MDRRAPGRAAGDRGRVRHVQGTAKGKDQTLYEADYLAIKELQSLAMETGVAIVVVHHTRKSG
ncbi:hypothetical protein, partial [Streptomyces niveiscabiei]|uniref:hypothetical protein n=1 Tax=Streptomyces niveiscabiei TaxID=164115 RepID=UPI0038F6DC6E